MKIERHFDSSKPLELPIDGTLDLHTFHPREVKELLVDYLAACRDREILQVRIIHGKGTGTMRRMVHTVLASLPEVISFRLGNETGGSWGATICLLHPTKKGPSAKTD